MFFSSSAIFRFRWSKISFSFISSVVSDFCSPSKRAHSISNWGHKTKLRGVSPSEKFSAAPFRGVFLTATNCKKYYHYQSDYGAQKTLQRTHVRLRIPIWESGEARIYLLRTLVIFSFNFSMITPFLLTSQGYFAYSLRFKLKCEPSWEQPRLCLSLEHGKWKLYSAQHASAAFLAMPAGGAPQGLCIRWQVSSPLPHMGWLHHPWVQTCRSFLGRVSCFFSFHGGIKKLPLSLIM